jgi:hypothetical protein
MMHGHERSDSVIVAVKPANNVARPAAEQSVAGLAAAEPVSQGRRLREMRASKARAGRRAG